MTTINGLDAWITKTPDYIETEHVCDGCFCEIDEMASEECGFCEDCQCDETEETECEGCFYCVSSNEYDARKTNGTLK